MVSGFFTRGWTRFAFDPAVKAWADHALVAGRKAIGDPAFARWHVCQGTWFVGVDALDNDAQGRVGGSQSLGGPAVAFIKAQLGAMPPLHRAQLSVVWPGYPRPREGESTAAFGYRQRRDAAHVDGVKPTGPDRRRRIEECHSFILGLPLTHATPDAAPLVVWEGSHEVMRRALRDALSGIAPADWHRVDLTDAYTGARTLAFRTCRRTPLHAEPGEAYLMHRLVLHGVAPWADSAGAGPDGRVIAYFRPEMAGGIPAWLGAP